MHNSRTSLSCLLFIFVCVLGAEIRSMLRVFNLFSLFELVVPFNPLEIHHFSKIIFLLLISRPFPVINMKRSSSQMTKQNIRTRKRARPNEEQSISTLERGEQAAPTRKREERLIRVSPQDDSYESSGPSEEEEDADTRNTRMSQVKIDVSRPFMIDCRADCNDFRPGYKGTLSMVGPAAPTWAKLIASL